MLFSILTRKKSGRIFCRFLFCFQLNSYVLETARVVCYGYQQGITLPFFWEVLKKVF